VLLAEGSVHNTSPWMGLRGALPAAQHLQTVPRAELHALHTGPLHTAPAPGVRPISVRANASVVVLGFQRGRSAVASSTVLADLWALVWRRVGELCGHGAVVTAQKVRAHADERDRKPLWLESAPPTNVSPWWPPVSPQSDWTWQRAGRGGPNKREPQPNLAASVSDSDGRL
jgi:hypothetical protein